MQKVFRRTTLARNQATRRARIEKKKEERLEVVSYLRERTQLERTKLDLQRDERLRRREDWFKGSIAPNRDSGPQSGAYGTLQPQDTYLPRLPKHLRRRYINIASGDRVVILKGPDQGKICEVQSVDLVSESVTLIDHNQVDIQYPEWARTLDNAQDKFITNNAPIPVDDVRLVCTLEDNGRHYEVIAKHVYGAGPYLQRSNSSTPKHTRYIAGENIRIPWPEETKVDATNDEDGDTSRKEVEYETWVPSLSSRPFQKSVMDELRNKYSKYRARHDPAWVEARKLEDLREEYLKSRTLLTPAGEYMAKLAAEKEAARKAKLDEDGNYIMDKTTADFIAQFVERNRAGKGSGPASKRTVN